MCRCRYVRTPVAMGRARDPPSTRSGVRRWRERGRLASRRSPDEAITIAVSTSHCSPVVTDYAPPELLGCPNTAQCECKRVAIGCGLAGRAKCPRGCRCSRGLTLGSSGAPCDGSWTPFRIEMRLLRSEPERPSAGACPSRRKHPQPGHRLAIAHRGTRVATHSAARPQGLGEGDEQWADHGEIGDSITRRGALRGGPGPGPRRGAWIGWLGSPHGDRGRLHRGRADLGRSAPGPPAEWLVGQPVVMPMAWRPRGRIGRTPRIAMPDPVSEYAEYFVVARGGITKLFLSQRGRLQDPGTVTVVCAPRLGPKQAVARWLSRIRRTVMAWLSGVGVETEARPRHAAAAPTPLAGVVSGVPQQSHRTPGRDAPAQSGRGERAKDVT